MRYNNIIHGDILSCSKTEGTKAPAIHVHLMNYSHRSSMHAVAIHVNYLMQLLLIHEL